MRPSSGSGRTGHLAGGKEPAVHAGYQREELVFIRRLNDEHAAAVAGRKSPVVEVIAIHGDQRPAQLPRQPEMFQVGRAPQFVVFDDEQDVPVECGPHVRDEAGRHIGVCVDAGTG